VSRKRGADLVRNRRFESVSLQRRVLANLTRSIRSPKILPSGFGSRVGRLQRRVVCELATVPDVWTISTTCRTPSPGTV